MVETLTRFTCGCEDVFSVFVARVNEDSGSMRKYIVGSGENTKAVRTSKVESILLPEVWGFCFLFWL